MAGTITAGLRAFNRRETVAKVAKAFAGGVVGGGVAELGNAVSQIIWNDNQETPAESYARHNALVQPSQPPPAQAGPSRGKKRSHREAFTSTIFDSSPSGTGTALTEPFVSSGSSKSLSAPTQPWYRIQNSLRVNPNSSLNWLRYSGSRSLSSSTLSRERRNARHLDNLSWFRTRVLLKSRARVRRRYWKAQKKVRWARHLFSRRPIPPVGHAGHLRRVRLQRARLLKLNFRKSLATKKSAQWASRYYRRLVRRKQRSRRRR